MIRITHVRSGLCMDTDSPQRGQGGVNGERNQRVEDAADVHDALRELDEEGENGKDDGKTCRATQPDQW